MIAVPARDADVVLSDLGIEQASALGRWLQTLPPDESPDAVWCSPYARARLTAQIALDAAGSALQLHVDERLRDRDLGVLDTLTSHGVNARYPQEAERRRWVGKFYYRPPGGESWTDIALRVRSVLNDLDRLEDGRRVLVVTHDAVVLLVRYVCEGLDEQSLAEVARTAAVRNAGVTRLVRGEGNTWQLADFNRDDHLAATGTAVDPRTEP